MPDAARPGTRGAARRRRRGRVRRARVRRRQGRPHRRARARQQGDALLPLPEQGRPLSRDPARPVRRASPPPSRPGAAGGAPDDQIRRFVERRRARSRRAAALSGHLAARDRRGRPPSRRARSSARCGASSRRSARSSRDGRATGVFGDAHPFVTQIGIVAPLLLFVGVGAAPRALQRTCCPTPSRRRPLGRRRRARAGGDARGARPPIGRRTPQSIKETSRMSRPR